MGIKLAGLILIFSIILFSKAFCQNLYVTGKIINKETGASLDNVTIKIYKGANIIFNTISDSTGNFKIEKNYYKQASYIIIHSLNFEDVRIDKLRPTDGDLDKDYDLGTFKISVHGIQLKDVVVKAKKRYRDTTIIDLSKQKFERSVMIDDLLSKNHGFYKGTDGQLYYKGKQVADLVVNGGDFFGKKNLDIYKLLPALVLENIQIVETNIDSTTNTTTLRPTIRVSLRLKEKYNAGKFGNATIGIGDANRYIAAADLYLYKNREQISLSLNSNNIDITNNPPHEPAIGFSVNGNNTITHNTRFTYSNIFWKKVELDISTIGKIEDRNFTLESERQDQVINQFSKSTNRSKLKSSGLSEAKLNLRYRIDSLNTLNITQTGNYNKTTQDDSTNYLIKFDSLNNISNLGRMQKRLKNTMLTEVSYMRGFVSKKGRSLNIAIKNMISDDKISEFDNIYNLTNNALQSYFVNSSKKLNERSFSVNSSFYEPLSDDSYLNLFLVYDNNRIHYNNEMTSDSLFQFLNNPAKISNQYIQSGLKLQKTFHKVSFDGAIKGLFDLRNNLQDDQTTHMSFFNINIDLNVDYKINDKKSLSMSFKTAPNYPQLNQLININNLFNLISQTNSNLNLKPEIDNSFKLSYGLRKSDSESINVNAGADFYTSRYGLNINALPNEIQSNFIDNIGKATNTFIGLSVNKNISDKLYFNYTNSISYQEQPTIINKIKNLNNAISFNQVISTTKEIFKNILSFSPVITATYSKYYYEASSSNVINLTYSDKLSLSVAKFNLDLYPLINYSRSITTLTSFSMNGAIKRSLFKGYGIMWLQGYDLFNSFKFNNNLLGSSYTETTKYSNVKRYFIIGLSLKFNNLK